MIDKVLNSRVNLTNPHPDFRKCGLYTADIMPGRCLKKGRSETAGDRPMLQSVRCIVTQGIGA